jgi:ribonuclease P protein component
VFVLPGHDVPRVGLTTPRAIGKSVFRNRLKRRLREALRLELPGFRKPVDYVFHPRKVLADTPMPALRVEVRRVMERCAKS